MTRSSYAERDYVFGHMMLTLRTATGLTQARLAELLGISRRAVVEWEAGSSYPKAEHLKHFIRLGIQHQAFPLNHEAEAIRTLWKAAHQKVFLDEEWLSQLLRHPSAWRQDGVSTPSNGKRVGHAGLPMLASASGGKAVLLQPTSTSSAHRQHLLATKFHVPTVRPQLVSRAHLVERVQRGVQGPLTLLSAPAGFGKTTLLAQWFQQSHVPAAWLSLESEDNDPARFLIALILALQTLDAQIGTAALVGLQTPHPPSPEEVLVLLVNELLEHNVGERVLVLDDYHLITTDALQRAIAFLVEHLPPQLHLLLATRTDPALPLAWLRARGQLMEVHAADLRFGAAETRIFLQEVMHLDLATPVMATLEQRTEGWIAGLQLAALSLQGKADPAAFLATFSGRHHFVLDYLTDEVLARQSESVQAFLLHTCLLERLSGSLCDAVLEQEDSQARLEALTHANLFVVALDDEYSWYRYHQLFAEALIRTLEQREPQIVPHLHRRASTWYEQHNWLMEAVQHALAIPDPALAARLIERIMIPMAHQGRLFTVLKWVQALPQEVVHARPLLAMSYARLLMYINQLEGAEQFLQTAERHIQSVQIPAEQAQLLWGGILSTRAAIATFSGDLPRTVSLARQALDLLPETEALSRPAMLGATLHFYQLSGDVTPDAEREVARTAALIRSSNNPFAIVASICLLAQLQLLQGRLQQAHATYAQVVEAVPHREMLHTLFPGLFYYFGQGNLLREWNDLEPAERSLQQGMAMINERLPIEPLVTIQGYTALARVQQARRDRAAALATLDALAHLAQQRRFAPELRIQQAAVRAQLELAQGNMAAAIHWADASGLSLQDPDVSYPRENEYLILARVRLVQGREAPASRLLKEVLHLLDLQQASAEANARLSSVREILVVRALALAAQDKQQAALATLERVLVQAEPEGYIRLFVDEGAPMVTLLRHVQAHSAVPRYVATLLGALEDSVSPSQRGRLRLL
jgi:LuxR family maltose regulon positive regulatory protein